jgi:trehalose 6-phosphate synthase
MAAMGARRSAARAPAAAAPGRLVVVSNRLPVTLSRGPDGHWRAVASSGGLVTALVPLLRDRGGVWIGWPGVIEEDAPEQIPAFDRAGFTLRSVLLSGAEHRGFYYGFANEAIWPLFHDLQGRAFFEPEYWRSYLAANRKFAEATHAELRPGDLVWVHDYHLMGVAAELRRRGVAQALNFFLHIPFPPIDIYAKLPWRRELLELLLAYDLLGFQTPRDRRNFMGCVEALIPEVEIDRSRPLRVLRWRGHEVRVGAFPIGIDHQHFARAAATIKVTTAARRLRQQLGGLQLILGIDRLDYTKGITFRLDAYREALIRHPELVGAVTFVQVLVPSRERIPQYEKMRRSIEQLVGEISGVFSRPGWAPVHYMHRALDRDELLAFYRASGVALITPLKDGMNLVSKEYCAANVELDGVLVLSEFAGAAWQLAGGALLVNPYDREGVADRIYEACTMPAEERRRRMRKLRRAVREHDLFWWVDAFLGAASAASLATFPRRPERRAGEAAWTSELGPAVWVVEKERVRAPS